MGALSKWISSAGGPLVCMEQTLAFHWKGEDQSKYSDYRCACNISDYLGVLPVHKGFSLVLGDMPLETAIYLEKHCMQMIIRVFYKNPDINLVNNIENIDRSISDRPKENLEFTFNSSSIVIFDSALPGNDIVNDSLKFSIMPGRYGIETHLLNPDPQTSMLVHKFWQRS
jgi:hypothetical protein